MGVQPVRPAPLAPTQLLELHPAPPVRRVVPHALTLPPARPAAQTMGSLPMHALPAPPVSFLLEELLLVPHVGPTVLRVPMPPLALNAQLDSAL